MIKRIGLDFEKAINAIHYVDICIDVFGKYLEYVFSQESGYVEFSMTLGTDEEKELTQILEYYGGEDITFLYNGDIGDFSPNQLKRAKEAFNLLVDVGLFEEAFIVTTDDYFEIECNKEQAKIVEKVLKHIEKNAWHFPLYLIYYNQQEGIHPDKED